MEFWIERGALAEAVAWAARSLPARSPVPVLGGLILDAAEGRLRISGFDYEASATIEVPAETLTAGRVLVLGRRLLDICRVLPDEMVTCALEGRRFTMEGGGTRFGLSTLPMQEYPALPELPAFRGTLDAAEFAAAVAQVVIAAGRDDSLPVLTGIQLRLDGESMTLAATDRYRYAVRVVPWKPDGAASDAVEVVVPGRRLTEISRALAKSGLIRIGLNGTGGAGGGLIAFEGTGMHTTLRLLEGRLPRYDKLFTLDSPAVAVAEREALADAVRRVAVVAEPNSPIRLGFSAQGTVLLQAGYEDDIASQQLAATLADADDLVVAFNPAYLLEALSSFNASQVRFELLGPGQRALLSGVPDEDDAAREDHRHLLISVRQLS
ncbi:DNA polymerase III subunit beta [Streptomyces pluripotens]|uniref:DNA polymerase III subunit beta n=1 Tax=Streptomyces pluripotens TaxID=1355015 RepID=A0A221P8V8_9ACTN|nr:MULTISPECIES: DNA polymerase III subunit beta [Streptomyces]ARP71528.1 DNA polymerase III subunit beta [Streptomyces pluripotens]ASN28526.1 DNA polymerase III subunit beta [Streptomyces pluripotens]KIE25091.1 DNA polymerase III subunit beta [Streptomyces sp. MUSC 125]MCH0557446.1 DNA polymerase III subunit beta [Streptomyces sp. MUM 16J]